MAHKIKTMSIKVKGIKIKNLKNIGEIEVDFKGCTAIVTAGNNKGKSTLLRDIVERIRFNRPAVPVKDGEREGFGEISLTNGEKFEWQFDVEGKDAMKLITGKIKQNVTKDIMNEYFPPSFDIDKFLQSTPKEQSKQLQKIIGLDFTDIDSRHDKAYKDRTAKNYDAERYHAKLVEMLEVPKTDPVDITALTIEKEQIRNRLNTLYVSNKSANDKARSAWNEAKAAIDVEVKEYNDSALEKAKKQSQDARDKNNAAREEWRKLDHAAQKDFDDAKVEMKRLSDAKDKANYCVDSLISLGYSGKELFDWYEAMPVIKEARKIQIEEPVLISELFEPQLKEAQYPEEPDYPEERPDDAELVAIDAKLLAGADINARAAEYKNYIAYKATVEAAQTEAKEADDLVKSIEAEREAMILRANMPKGISITPDGITVDGFPLDRSQISKSKESIAALRIGAMKLGEVKVMYFDASFLDRNGLNEVEAWAWENDLQLLIERPDFEGSEIQYELIEH